MTTNPAGQTGASGATYIPPNQPPAAPSPGPGEPPASPRVKQSISPLLIVAVAVALVAVVVVILLVSSGSGSSNAASAPATARAPTKIAPSTIVSSADLHNLAATSGHPVYWAGIEPGHSLELSRFSDGSIEVRYLNAGVAPGTAAQNWLAVVTYPLANSYALEQQGANRRGAQVQHLSGGALLVSPPGRPTNEFLSYPGSPVLVEVYDPVPSSARHLVLTGRVRTIL